MFHTSKDYNHWITLQDMRVFLVKLFFMLRNGSHAGLLKSQIFTLKEILLRKLISLFLNMIN